MGTAISSSLIDPQLRLPECPLKTTTMVFPVPVDVRLDGLVTVLTEGGDRTSRQELTAALIFHAPDNATQLSKILRAFRTGRAGEAQLASQTPENVLTFQRQKPGRRKRAPQAG